MVMRSTRVAYFNGVPSPAVSTYSASAGGVVPAASVKRSITASGSIVILRPGM